MGLKIAVLGCGPAGLIAAHGAGEAALDRSEGDSLLKIFSVKRKSPLYGAQYLHSQIPHLGLGEVNKTTVSYVLEGSASDYRRKVYGSMFNGQVSPEALTERHDAWDIREAYDRLWSMYEAAIVDVELDAVSLHEILDDDWDVVINSVPLDRLCYQGHNFRSQEVIAAGDAPDLGINIGKTYSCPPNSVILSGNPEVSWYRKSNIFGHTTVEWPGKLERVAIASAAKVLKPIDTDCTCWPSALRVGRYGTWKKGVLSHEAYELAYSHAEQACFKKALR